MGDRMRLPDGMGAPMGAVAEGPEQQAAEPDYTIPYEDLREWIAQAEKLGEIRHVKGASWQEVHSLPVGDSAVGTTVGWNLYSKVSPVTMAVLPETSSISTLGL